MSKDPSVVTLSTGVRLRAVRLPSILLADIVAKHNPTRPTPPRVMVVSKGREEENPDDPRYLEAMSGWQAGLIAMVNNAFLVMGTSIEFIPEGFERPEDPMWFNKISALGMGLGGDSDSRYLAWVKYIAGPDNEDVQKLIGEVGRLSGVSEGDVQTAVDQFRR